MVETILLCNIRLLPTGSKSDQIEFVIYEKEAPALKLKLSLKDRRCNTKSLFEASVFSFIPLDVYVIIYNFWRIKIIHSE